VANHIVKIDKFDNLEWIVDDEKLNELIYWLAENGVQQYYYNNKIEKQSIWFRIFRQLTRRKR